MKHIKNYILAILFLTIILKSNALFAVEKTYTETGAPLKEIGMNILADGNYHILAGTVLTANGYKITIKKVDFDGIIQWSQVYGLQANNYDTRCMAIDHNLGGNGYVITGYVDFNTSPTLDNTRAYMANISAATGAITWSKIYDHPNNVGLDIKKTQSNGYVIAGFSSEDSLALFTSKTGFVLNTDNIGNTNWFTEYNTANYTNTPDYDMAESIFPYLDNGNNQRYYVTGSQNEQLPWDIGAGLTINGTSQVVLSSLLDNNGTSLWNNSFSTIMCSNPNNSNQSYYLQSGADAYYDANTNRIIQISNSTKSEGAFLSVIDANTGILLTTRNITENGSPLLRPELHVFSFSNLYVSNDTLYIYGIATNIYCSSSANQTRIYSPFELVLEASNNFQNFAVVSSKIFRLKNIERQDQENGLLRNKQGYINGFGGGTINCATNINPTIYTPKIGINKGPKSPNMPIVLDFPSNQPFIGYDIWMMGIVGQKSIPPQTISQETYMNGKTMHPCHMLQLHNPQLTEITINTYTNAWGQVFISDYTGTEFSYSYSYDLSNCLQIITFMDCDPITGQNFTVGINQNKKETINIAPNPANNFLIITVPQFNAEKSYYMSIYNMEGKQIFSSKLLESKTKIDLNTLPAGIYFVKIQQNGILIHNDKLAVVQ
ncbi:MAG: T9SS type A sorting domain-containing protein [Bacteroidetes bacterium]|nr:T9SS type A sorting domain-containing protein [Bacteroidota bacterium]